MKWIFAFFVLSLAAPSPADAATRTWDGGGANDSWTTSLNWNPNGLPTAGDDLVFDGGLPLHHTNDFAAGFDFGNITFTSPGYVARGNALDLTNGLTLLGAIGPIEFHPDVRLNADQTITVSRFNAALNLHGALNLNGHTPTFFMAGTANLFGPVSGAGGLILNNGTLVLHTNNSCSGAAQLDSGTMLVFGANPDINVTVTADSTLRGTGLVRRITCTGGTVAPGSTAPGAFGVIATTALNPATTFAVRLQGTNAGGQHDQLVTASLTLGGAALQVAVDFPIVVGQNFTLINVTGGTAVTGTFGGLAEGALFVASNMQFQITYAGGTGNDVVITAVAQQPGGVTRTWDGGGVNDLWTTPANWVGDVAPNPGDALIFPGGAARMTNANDFPAGVTFQRITINGAGYLITGNGVALLGSGIVHAGYPSGTSTLGVSIRLTANSTVVNFVATAPTLILSGDLDLGPHNISFVCEGPIILSGVVSGTGDIFKGKNPVIRFTGSAANTHSGVTQILGLCELNKPPGVTALVGPLFIGNEFAGAGEVRLLANDQISDAATVTVFTAATFNGNGFNETIGSLCLTGGVVTTMGGTLTVLGTVETKASASIASLSGNLTLGGAGDRDFIIANGTAAPDLNISAVISGGPAVHLRKIGPGQLRLSGTSANTHAGVTRLHAGLLELSKTAGGVPAVAGSLEVGDGAGVDVVRLLASSEIGNSSPVFIGSSGQLDLNNFSDVIGPLTMQGGSVVTGNGLLTLGGDVSAWGPGPATISGHLALGAGAQRLFDLASGATLQIDAEMGGATGITLLKTNAGELFLPTSNVLSGPVRLAAGTLRVSVDGALGNSAGATIIDAGVLLLDNTIISTESLVVHGGTLRGQTLSAWNGSVTLHGDATVETTFPTTFTFTGLISGPGGFIKNGNGGMRLRGQVANTFTGTTRVNEGDLDVYSLGVTAVSGPLIAGDNVGTAGSVEVRYGGNHQIADTAPVTIRSDAQLNVASWVDTIGPITLEGGRIFGAGAGEALTVTGNILVQANAQTATIETRLILNNPVHLLDTVGTLASPALHVFGEWAGPGGFTKTGAGQVWLSTGNSYAGLTRIEQGRVSIAHSNALGPTGDGTTVTNSGALYVSSGITVAEPLTLSGNGDGSSGALVNQEHTNTFLGAITLAGNTRVGVFGVVGRLQLNGPISGPGHLEKTGSRTLSFGGPDANSFTGLTRVDQAELELAKPAGVVAVPGALLLGDDLGGALSDSVRLLNSNQISDLSEVTVASSGWLNCSGLSEQIGSLAGPGLVTLGLGHLTLGSNNLSRTFSGMLSNAPAANGLTKIGSGTQTLSGTDLFTGSTLVQGGTLLVHGWHQLSSVEVRAGATLGGSGVVQHIVVRSGGTLSPGASPGVLTAGGMVSFQDATSVFRVELDGLAAGSGHDQLHAPFAVSLGNSTLQVVPGFSPPLSNSFVIVNKDGASLVTGTFNGLPEGATFPAGGFRFQVTYAGGDGNDVALLRVAAPASQMGSIVCLTNGFKQLSGIGIPGLAYTFEATTDLNLPILWTALGTNQADGSGFYQLIDNQAPLFPMRSYRARSP